MEQSESDLDNAMKNKKEYRLHKNTTGSARESRDNGCKTAKQGFACTHIQERPAEDSGKQTNAHSDCKQQDGETSRGSSGHQHTTVSMNWLQNSKTIVPPDFEPKPCTCPGMNSSILYKTPVTLLLFMLFRCLAQLNCPCCAPSPSSGASFVNEKSSRVVLRAGPWALELRVTQPKLFQSTQHFLH